MDRLLNRRVFGPADAFRMLLEFGPAACAAERERQWDALVRLPRALTTVELQWDDTEAESAVVDRFAQCLSSVQGSHGEERVVVAFRVTPGASGGAGDRVELQLQYSLINPALRCINFARVTPSGTASDSLLRAMLQHCQLDTVWKLKGAEGYGNFWASCVDPKQLTQLRNMNLSYCGLTSLPGSISQLATLRILRLSHNKLSTLPADLGQLTALEVLAADANQLLSVPVELRNCASLRDLNLEGNRIATAMLDLRLMQHTLQSLQLFGNPLEYLPELLPCVQLRSLSLANVRIMADATYTRWEVEVTALPYMARAHKLAPLFRLAFRRASLQHPLLAGALGRIAEDKNNCELIAKEEVAIQQLVLMSLSDNSVVVRQACKTLGHLAACGVGTVQRLMVHDVGTAVQTLIRSPHQDAQLCGLNVLSALCSSSETVSAELMSDDLLARLHLLICKGDPAVRQTALHCLAALCYLPANRRAVRASPGLLCSITMLAQVPSGGSGTPSRSRACSHTFSMSVQQRPFALSRQVLEQQHQAAHGCSGGNHANGNGAATASPHDPVPGANLGFASGSTRLSALRVLAVLGENEVVREALNVPPIQGRGVRVLALDGGGMKGIALVQMMRAMQARLPQPLHTYFDLVVGTSTGAIVAVSMAVLCMGCDEVEAIYTELGQKVFNAARVAGASDESSQASWRDSLYRVYRSTGQHMRVAVYGSKHDPTAFETLLKDFADLKKLGCLSDQLIDTAALPGIPKLALVATSTSVRPASPFVFRTYELPVGSEQLAAHISACDGSSRHPIWQAIRASASAPYYLDDFPCGEDRYQDGAITANNPSLIALQQARLLWPWLPVECLVSLGCGMPPPVRRERSTSSFLDTGSVLIESACSTSRVHEALATMLQLMPQTSYFRFQPMDERFAVELDDVSPASIAKLQTATSEYCMAHGAHFDALAGLLSRPTADGGAAGAGVDGSASSGAAAQLASLDAFTLPTDASGVRAGRPAALFLGAPAAGGLAAAAGRVDSLGARKGDGRLLVWTAGPSGHEVEPLPPSPGLSRYRGLLVLQARRQQPCPPGAAPPDLQAATAAALATLPSTLRATDLTATCAAAAAAPSSPHAKGTVAHAHVTSPAAAAGEAAAAAAGAAAGGVLPLSSVGSMISLGGGVAAAAAAAAVAPSAGGGPLPPQTLVGPPSTKSFTFDRQVGSGGGTHNTHAAGSPIHMPGQAAGTPSGQQQQPGSASGALDATLRTSVQLPDLATVTPAPPPASIRPLPHATAGDAVAAATAAAAASSAASTSIFSYFLPKWGATSSPTMSSDGSAPAPPGTAPGPLSPSSQAIVAPAVQTVRAAACTTASPQSHPLQDAPGTATTTSPPLALPVQQAAEAAQQQQQQQAALKQVAAPSAVLWFPWSSAASMPTSPVVSPTMADATGGGMLSLKSAKNAFSPPPPCAPLARQHAQHARQSRGGAPEGSAAGAGVGAATGAVAQSPLSPRSYGSADAGPGGPFLFRSRSRTEAGPPSLSNGNGGSLRSPQASLSQAPLTHPHTATPLDSITGSSGSGGGSPLVGGAGPPGDAHALLHQSASEPSLQRTDAGLPLPPTEHLAAGLATHSGGGAVSAGSQAGDAVSADSLAGGALSACGRMGGSSSPPALLVQQQQQQQPQGGLQVAPSLQHRHWHGRSAEPPASGPGVSDNDGAQQPTADMAAPVTAWEEGKAVVDRGLLKQLPRGADAGGRVSSSGEPRVATQEAAPADGTNGAASAVGAVAVGTAVAASGGPKAMTVIQGLLEDLGEQGLGVVHLALDADAEHQALVTQWSDEVVAVMEPSAQAAQLVRQLGGDPAAGDSLARVTGGALTFSSGLTRWVRLGAHEVVTPSGLQVRSSLLSISQPAQVLMAHDVLATSVAWSSLVVTASCVVPRPLLEAFVRAGVKAVVCLSRDPETREQQEALPGMFHALLKLCTAGAPMMEAVAAAEGLRGGLCKGLLVCHHK